jgi:peptidoglycan glycosyltransferase
VQSLSDGHRILYTLDPVLQDAAQQIFRNREVPYAAAVILDVRDNSVLALAGHSSMDPQVDPLEITTTAWAPAASTFKLVTAAALLKQNRAIGKTKVCFSGGLHGITDDLLSDDAARDTACDDLGGAIAHSHNVVVAKLALKHLTAGNLGDITKTFRFGSEIPFEFRVEPSPAVVPDDPKERARVAAGFWHVDMSPLHGALLASVFARDGVWQPPHIVAQVRDASGADRTPALPASERVLPKDIADQIGEMMVRTTSEGTARGSFRDRQGVYYITDAEVAGKTGSLTGKRAPGLNYNWFVGYAPAERPEIAFAVLLANEPKWRIKAHYAARRLVQIYLSRKADIEAHRDARLTETGVELPGQAEQTAAARRQRAPAGRQRRQDRRQAEGPDRRRQGAGRPSPTRSRRSPAPSPRSRPSPAECDPVLLRAALLAALASAAHADPHRSATPDARRAQGRRPHRRRRRQRVVRRRRLRRRARPLRGGDGAASEPEAPLQPRRLPPASDPRGRRPRRPGRRGPPRQRRDRRLQRLPPRQPRRRRPRYRRGPRPRPRRHPGDPAPAARHPRPAADHPDADRHPDPDAPTPAPTPLPPAKPEPPLPRGYLGGALGLVTQPHLLDTANLDGGYQGVLLARGGARLGRRRGLELGAQLWLAVPGQTAPTYLALSTQALLVDVGYAVPSALGRRLELPLGASFGVAREGLRVRAGQPLPTCAAATSGTLVAAAPAAWRVDASGSLC